MIKKILVKNFVLIDELETGFNEGLNILTGETGSGKSIIIDAIDMAFGARASRNQIRTGTGRAYIELELADGTVLSREITPSSTKSRINGVLVSQSEVQGLRKTMLDIHTQHESYSYIHPGTHIGLLDNYGQETYGDLLNSYRKTFDEHGAVLSELEAGRNLAGENERRIDFLKFQVQEITDAKIEDTNEYDGLLSEREVLVNTEELKDIAMSGYSALYGEEQSITDTLSMIEKRLLKAAELDKSLSGIAEVISSSSINLKEASKELRNYADNIYFDAGKLSGIEERLNLIEKLMKKYGPKLPDVLENLEKFKAEFNEISSGELKLSQLELQEGILCKKLKDYASQLSIFRQKLAQTLSSLVQEELFKLEMPGVQFKVNVESGDELTARGYDSVEFLISPNAGEPLKPLAKIASGGEISRVMLAIKTIFARADRVNTVIFDEIDTGISGKTSRAVAGALSELSLSQQVICITHQPIIAAIADLHIQVSKFQDETSTGVYVKSLDDDGRVRVLAELAGGRGGNEEALSFAQKLLNQKRRIPIQ